MEQTYQKDLENPGQPSIQSNKRTIPNNAKDCFSLLPYKATLFMSRKGAFSLLVDYIKHMSKSFIYASQRDLGRPNPKMEEHEDNVTKIRIGRAASICNNASRKTLAAKMLDGTILLHVSKQYDPITFWPILLKTKMDELDRRQTIGDQLDESEKNILYGQHVEPIDAYTLYGGTDEPKKPKRPFAPGEFKFAPWEDTTPEGRDEANKAFGGTILRRTLERLVNKQPEFN